MAWCDRRRALAAAAGLLTAAALPPVRADAIDRAVRDGMARTGGRGLAVALVEDGRVAFARAYGARDAAGAPLTPDTILYGASLTKPVFALACCQIAADGRLDLDRPVAALLPRPLPDYGDEPGYADWRGLADDPRWRAITPRHCLTHATGFANFGFMERDGRLRIHTDPGSRYSYSGDGFILLQFALERGLGLDMGAEVDRRILRPLGMARTALAWRDDLAGDVADGWRQDGRVDPHRRRQRVRAAGSMDTCLADFARFAAAFSTLPGAAAMLRPQRPIRSASQFPVLQPDAAAPVPGLYAGLGLVLHRGIAFKGGHDDSTGNLWIADPAHGRAAVLLANDVRAEAAFPAIVAASLGDVAMPWRWEYGA